MIIILNRMPMSVAYNISSSLADLVSKHLYRYDSYKTCNSSTFFSVKNLLECIVKENRFQKNSDKKISNRLVSRGIYFWC